MVEEDGLYGVEGTPDFVAVALKHHLQAGGRGVPPRDAGGA